MNRPDKRKLVDWKKKNGSDDERISKRLDRRAQLEDASTTKNDAKPKLTVPVPSKAPLIKQRKKIKEVFDEDEDDEQEITTAPFFNISLIDDEQEHEQSEKKEKDTLRITKEQQLVSKLNIIMDTAINAEKLGLSSQITSTDLKRLYDAEHNPSELLKKTINDKISKPLGLKGKIDETQLRPTLEALKELSQEFSEDALSGVPIRDLPEITQAPNQEEMAKMILKKSGRTSPKRKSSKLAKENINNDLTLNKKENENQ